MERDVLNNMSTHAAAEGEDQHFAASDYFLGIVQRVLTSGENTRIALGGNGQISLFPGRNSYSGRVADMAAFCQAPAEKFEMSPLGPAASPGESGKSIEELMWQAAFYASNGRLIDGCSKYDVVKFRRWPNLSRLPKSPNTMRICALLTRFPTTIMLTHRRLGAEKEEIYQTYSAAYCAGLVNMVSRNPQATVSQDATEPAEESPGRRRNLLRALLAKISGL